MGSEEAAGRRRPNLADESAGNSLPAFHQVCRAARAVLYPVHSHFLHESDVPLCARARIPKLFCRRKFLSEILCVARKHRHDRSDMPAEPVFYCHRRRINIRTFPRHDLLRDRKNDKEGYRLPDHLELLEYIWRLTTPIAAAFCLESMRTPAPLSHFFSPRWSRDRVRRSYSTRTRTANSLPLRFKRVLQR